jgi:hypothetical protein
METASQLEAPSDSFGASKMHSCKASLGFIIISGQAWNEMLATVQCHV